MDSVTCLITGATDGIGKALATRLAAAGHDVILHGRNFDKLAAVAAEVDAISSVSVSTVCADFADLEQVASLATVIRADYPNLNLLVNNAGHLTDHRQESADAYELTFAVNYLAPFLLTNLLLNLSSTLQTRNLLTYRSSLKEQEKTLYQESLTN